MRQKLSIGTEHSLVLRLGKQTAIGSAASLLATLLFAGTVSAAAPTFPQLNQTDFDSAVREMSANSSLHSVLPPSSMGSIFGFEVGIVTGVAKTDNIDRLVKQAAPGTQVNYLPHAGLLGAVTVPFGITAEATFIPKTVASGVEYSSYAAALKWTLTDELLLIPANIAIRGFMAGSEMSWAQDVQGVAANVKYSGQVTGVQILASPKLIPVLEPYAGLGYLSAKGQMDITGGGGGTLFNFASASQSADSKPTSSQILLGLDVRLLLIGFGLEYSRAFDTDTYTGKLSLKF